MKPLSFSLALALTVFAPPSFGTTGDDMLKRYFELETSRRRNPFSTGFIPRRIGSPRRTTIGLNFFSMLGIDPKRERTDLKGHDYR